MFYFSLRGHKGSGFYKSSHRHPAEQDFYTAYSTAIDKVTPKTGGYLTSDMIDLYLDSANFNRLADRTKTDYRRWLKRFGGEFGPDPLAMFAEYESLDEIEGWREQWKHSPRQFDYAGDVVTILFNFAKKRGKLKQHYAEFENIYKADRAAIVWTQPFIDKFAERAPDHVTRVLIAATETGLRPADLVKLSRFNVEKLDSGNRRLRIPTQKRGQFAHIPVTPKMAKLIDSTPPGQELILLNASRQPWTERYASQEISKWKNKAGLSVKVLGYSLHLHDCRGTAVTRLLNAGADANGLATVFGWDLRYATEMIQVYAVIGSDQTDKILALYRRAEQSAATAK
ncbi:MAG: site-specific integrase, partial [Alphaproteobacteria bacterium]|nr:site-specific integrase [Alphaproteobacteria bacterium]